MNDFGWIVIGAAARATALAAIGLAAAATLRRRGPSAGALASSTTLAVLVALTGLAACPWPRWPPSVALAWPARPVEAPAPPLAVTASPPGAGASPERPTAEAARPPADRTGFADSFLNEFRRELADPSGPTPPAGWRWPVWAGVLFLAGLAFSMGRLVLGLWAVRTLRARSSPVGDPSLVALLGELRTELGLTRPVALLESADIEMPATVGWREPAVLLPPSWAGWTGHERRAVLAHELAHVLRGDYLAGLGAQLSLSLHFYHPLVHVLAHRLRLQQELAADAWGARLSGGRLPYLTTLAGLALRHHPRPSAWPARPFLPTRHTFLRRIEMLRDPNSVPQPGLPRRGQAATVAALTIAGLIVAGFRGPAPSPRASAQDRPAPAVDVVGKSTLRAVAVLDPTSAGSDVHLAIDINVSMLLRNPEIKTLVDAIPADDRGLKAALASGEIAQVLILGFNRDAAGVSPGTAFWSQFAFVIRSFGPRDWKPFMLPGAVEVQSDGVTYHRAGRAAEAICYRKLDEQTLLIGTEADAKLPPIGAGRPRGRHAWDDAWKKLPPTTERKVAGSVRLAFDPSWFNRGLRPGAGRPGQVSSMMTAFGPLFDRAQGYALRVNTDDGLALEALATAGNDEGAARVADTVRAALTLGRNALPDLRRSAEAAPGDSSRPLVDLTDALDAMLETARVEQQDAAVRLNARADASAVALAARMLIPAARASREAARRNQCVNHLKQLTLAMHNYHQANDRFPPAVLYGPDGKTPHSWRVALLPYLEGNEVYSRYKFDEPWDGPNNSKLILLMPAVFAHPGGPGEASPPGTTSYLVPTGPETIFPPRKEGVGLAEITDGSSNTILIVEGERAVPWTKPEDLPSDKATPFPGLGKLHAGGSNVAFADGGVRFLSATIDRNVLRALFTRDQGEVISLP